MKIIKHQVEELSMATGPGDFTTTQRAGRRVERFQGVDRGHVDPVDMMTDHSGTQIRGERLDLRQFRHPATVPSLP
jgi:hypothetical protein